ncbi:MAG: universal stress protein, partial [Spirosomaceae bacterium]|jgi:nucleotide-binding universal stress UspA family protein|nr:universal stress protein [Spirosomataceae bacterium]
MKKILVPTDFSPIANKALDVAVQLARPTGATIEVLNVNVFPVGAVGSYYSVPGATLGSIDDTWQEIMQDAKKSILELAAKYEDVKIKPVVEETTEHFIQEVLDHKADLIVMGSNGASGFKELLEGSNSEEIVRLASCPVLVIKDENAAFAPKKVVFAVDLSKHEQFIKKATSILPLESAECHFLYVDTDMEVINYPETKEKMRKLAEKLHIKNATYEITEAISILDGILGYAEDTNADLIVMYTHGRTGISHFFRGSIAEDVVNHAKIPVFTYVEN